MFQVQSSPHVVSAFETPEWGSQALHIVSASPAKTPHSFCCLRLTRCKAVCICSLSGSPRSARW